jgi:hypothetical protein
MRDLLVKLEKYVYWVELELAKAFFWSQNSAKNIKLKKLSLQALDRIISNKPSSYRKHTICLFDITL